MSKNFRWFVAGFILFLLIIAVVTAIHGDSESVIQEKRVDASDVYRFSYVSQGSEQTTDSDEVYYSDSFFMQDNGTYDHNLARASLALSMTAFKEKYADSLLEDMGYGNIVSYRYDQTGDEDKVALIMGYKEAEAGLVVAVAVRGGKYGDEWGSNGRVGYEGESFGYHYGFRKAAEDAAVQIKEYAVENNLKLGDAKVWIAGFSRGAAVANVLGALLVDGLTVSPNNLFDYTFASPSTVSESLVTETPEGYGGNINIGGYPGIYNVVNPLDIVTRLPMNASGISESARGNTVRYGWDYVKYGITLKLPAESESAQLQVVQLLENALAFATRNEVRYVDKTQDQVIIPALKKTMGKGANVSKRNVGFVLIEALPGVASFLKNEVHRLDFTAQIYVAGILSGKQSVRLEKEHWPETYWGWMVKTDDLE